MSIQNIVFDFGQVMVRFDPAYIVAQYVTDEEDARLLEEVLFDRLYWDRSDAGTITDEEILEACKERLPKRLHSVGKTIYRNWIYHLPEIKGMRELVRDCKNMYGKRVFLLSNISAYFAQHAHEIPCLTEFEKCIFSAVCGHIKPHADMFAHLCKDCDILPNETLFVDDNQNNIQGAEEYGIKGYLFDGNAVRLRAYLQTIL